MWKALSSVLCPLFPAMYLCHFFICINLRQPIFKIHVKILVPEIYSPSRGEVYNKIWLVNRTPFLTWFTCHISTASWYLPTISKNITRYESVTVFNVPCSGADPDASPQVILQIRIQTNNADPDRTFGLYFYE